MRSLQGCYWLNLVKTFIKKKVIKSIKLSLKNRADMVCNYIVYCACVYWSQAIFLMCKRD